MGLPYGDTVHECDRQTDGRTEGQTDRITITNAVHRRASHGKMGHLSRPVTHMTMANTFCPTHHGTSISGVR